MNGPLRIQNELKRVAALSEYHAAGWRCCLIEPGAKGPAYARWNVEPLDPNTNTVPAQYGLGLLHALSGTAALDVDDYEAAKTWLAGKGIDLDQLLSAPDAVQIVSGRPGSNKLLFKSWLPLPSKKVIINGRTVLELRCATADGKSVQDLLPVEGYLHASCGTPYQWGGQGSWTALQPLPDALLAVWTGLLTEGSSRPAGSRSDGTPANWGEVVSALHAIDPGCDRKTWVEVGMALHNAGSIADCDDEAYQLWFDWSQQSAKFKAREMPGQWRSFKEKPDGITVASLFHHADKAGWVRPVIVPDGVFFAVQGPVDQQPNIWMKLNGGNTLLTMHVPHPVLDMSILPPVLSATANCVSVSVGCDPAVSVAAGLVATCTAADCRITMIVKHGMELIRPIVRFGSVGNPADKKSPGSKPMFAPLLKIEFADKPRYQTELLIWHGKEAAYASAMKAYMAHSADPANTENSQPPEVPDLPPKPVPLRFTSNDASTAKLLGMLDGRPYGLTIYLDDGSEWLESLSNGNRYDSKTVWLNTYEGGSRTFDRVSSGEIFIENAAVPIYANLHPETLHTHRKKLSGDGTLQRFALIPLDTSKTNPGTDNPYHEETMRLWEEALKKVHAVGTSPGHYTLSDEARERWMKFAVENDKAKKDAQLCNHSTYLVAFIGKLDGFTARIALVFHLLTDPFNETVSGTTMANAIRFADYALRCAAFIDGAHFDNESIDRKVAEIIITACKEGKAVEITMSEILRSGKRKFDEMPKWSAEHAVRSAMEQLRVEGWVIVFQDHPRHPSWLINPELFGAVREQKEMLAKARADFLEKISK